MKTPMLARGVFSKCLSVNFRKFRFNVKSNVLLFILVIKNSIVAVLCTVVLTCTCTFYCAIYFILRFQLLTLNSFSPDIGLFCHVKRSERLEKLFFKMQKR